ncbi:hypothetical protein GCM10010398_12280 [Streptomyces fimbriatus]
MPADGRLGAGGASPGGPERPVPGPDVARSGQQAVRVPKPRTAGAPGNARFPAGGAVPGGARWDRGPASRAAGPGPPARP